MAAKEATIYVVDLGASTAECHNGRVESDLDFGMQYVWEKITLTLSENRASDLVGVLAFRTDDTVHQLALEEYPNISIVKPMGSVNMSHLRELRNDIKSSNTNEGDAISAVVVAIDLIQKATLLISGKPGKYKRTVVVLTDGQGPMDRDGLDDIAAQIKEVEIELKVVGIDFDDKEYGFKEEDKSEIKSINEKTLQELVENCDGTYGTVSAAIEYLSIPKVKETRPFSAFKGKLSLGDFNRYEETALYIDVNRWFKTKQKKPDPASTVISRPIRTGGSAQSSHTVRSDVDMEDPLPHNSDITAVKNDRVYMVKAEDDDPAAKDGKVIIAREELAKGYAYGSSAVAISEVELPIVKLETFTEFTIIGFIPSDKYERYLNMGESCITVAEPLNDKARMALSSLIHSLHELESYAVARLVRPSRKDSKEGKDPEVILLAPLIAREIEALIDVPLPFAEDVRLYRYPPLDRVITTSGTIAEKHRNLPGPELINAMSDYVDSMDLMQTGMDDDGEPKEYMAIEETYSPVLHRINQAVRRRATHPNEKIIEEPAAILTKYSKPPRGLIEKAGPDLQALIKAADIKTVPPKVKGRGKRQPMAPLSNLPIDELLKSRRRDKISSGNSIAEFRQMLDHADGTDNTTLLRDAAKQMGDIVRGLIRKHAVGATAGTIDEQVLENIRVFRHEMIEYEEPELYNKFIRSLKKDILSGNLGENLKELWFKVKAAKLGLIDNYISEKSEVLAAEATDFLNLKGTDMPTRTK